MPYHVLLNFYCPVSAECPGNHGDEETTSVLRSLVSEHLSHNQVPVLLIMHDLFSLLSITESTSLHFRTTLMCVYTLVLHSLLYSLSHRCWVFLKLYWSVWFHWSCGGQSTTGRCSTVTCGSSFSFGGERQCPWSKCVRELRWSIHPPHLLPLIWCCGV